MLLNCRHTTVNSYPYFTYARSKAAIMEIVGTSLCQMRHCSMTLLLQCVKCDTVEMNLGVGCKLVMMVKQLFSHSKCL